MRRFVCLRGSSIHSIVQKRLVRGSILVRNGRIRTFSSNKLKIGIIYNSLFYNELRA